MKYLISVLTLMLLAPQAQAHDLVAGGFISGLSHPVLGFDHLLAMLSVGVLSVQLGGRAIWTVPATFVAVMIAGGWLGIEGVPLPLVEFGIALSVLALGLALAANHKVPMVLSMAFVGFFALFHGHAHGTEMPHVASPVLYALGFVAGTSLIHLVGVFMGQAVVRLESGLQLMRYVGAAIAGAGFHLLVSV